MKKRILLVALMVAMLVCIFVLCASAAPAPTETSVTLKDGTTVPLYDENGEGLIWFIVDTDENGKNIYSSVPANKNTADNASNYITYGINSTYGTNQMHDMYINYWDAEAQAYVSYGKDNSEKRVVVMNMRTFEKEYWSMGSGWSSNLEYVYHSATVRDSGDFTGYANLKIVDFSLTTNFESFGEQAFKGCTSLREVRIGNSEKGYDLNCTNGNLFSGATSLVSIWIADPSDVKKIGGMAFYGCTAFTGTYEFPNVTVIEGQAFRNASTNDDTYLSLSFPSLVTLGGNSGDPHPFSGSGLREIYIGDDLKETGYQTFTNATKLWRVEIAGVAQGFEFKSYLFDGCSALKAFSIPEGVTALPMRMFRNCTSLTAVYLPSTLTAINSGDNDASTFKKCTSMYFVKDAFTYKTISEIPQEPEVYFFPNSITTVDGEIFDGARVNNIVVFGTNVTNFPVRRDLYSYI